MTRRRLSGRGLGWSLGFPLAGGAALAAFMHWSQQHWWVGPAVLAALALLLFALWHW